MRAATGRGSHLVFAYPKILIAEHPGIRAALRGLRNDFAQAFRQQLAGLAVRVDSTHDLRRAVRVYGTAKPTVGVNSRFYAQARREDAVLREYLLRRTTTPATTAAPASLVISTGLPLWFERLLGEDAHVQALWQNEGKPAGLDQTPSGYDYSLLRYLVGRGVTNPDELGTIISRRPEGSVVRHQKGLEYVSRTVANALARGGARGGDA